jgi:hypothetical protein
MTQKANHAQMIGEMSRTDFSINDKSYGQDSLALSNSNNSMFQGTFLTLTEEEKRKYQAQQQ